ncbi:tRNA lysidine(34) synthetase TilS [Apibacter muscae]|uniref:tRNA lysidine(34) synthetase TilS n=1 Tax=Apibacter muscae TaxID=2509004 RepID=UPI0011AD8BA4|nr:tRNA lysidine(34) synthetase TilS [Apibacter muscae]TWP24417.1 tRNA lysidine(34) synthetase TilS [Apibacter muscae]
MQKSINQLEIKKSYLLAISGGIDSMVLLHLFQQTSLSFSVAHCNFNLREEDSLKDEAFIREYCEKHKIKLHVKSFDTLKIKQKKESIEMVARDLRYHFFLELIKKYNYNYLVTAHHLNDHIETFFINLFRGAGLKGLSGIKKKRDYIIRPLLNFSRKEILEYAQNNGIIWREDYTNQSTDFLRNKIRHTIIPNLEDIKPNFIYLAKKSLSIIDESQKFIQKQVNLLKDDITLKTDSNVSVIDLHKLLNAESLLVYLLLAEFGFVNKKDCENILKSKTGSIFLSKTHKLWVNRNEMWVEALQNRTIYESEINLKINSIPWEIDHPLHVSLYSSKKHEKSESHEILDLNTISFPLYFRNWKSGDFFYPINGNGKKKVSKFLKDLKISNYEKNKTFVLCDGLDRIIWLVGYRLDDRFKITNNTTDLLNLRLHKNLTSY